MTRTLTDSTGAAVTIKTVTADTGWVSSYQSAVDDGTPVGRADFIDSENARGERIFFHTEVDHAYGGRGIASLLIAEALADSINEDVVVVPVCPFFSRHLRDHGEEFLAAGGKFRKPGPSDLAAVRLATLRNRRRAVTDDDASGP